MSLSKAEQTNKNRISKKPSMKNNNFASDEELLYFKWLFSDIRSCIVCGSSSVEYHHIKKHSSDKKDHKKIICLCKEHHTISRKISAHGNKKEFEKLYPYEVQERIADDLYKQFKNSSISNENDYELCFEYGL